MSARASPSSRSALLNFSTILTSRASLMGSLVSVRRRRTRSESTRNTSSTYRLYPHHIGCKTTCVPFGSTANSGHTVRRADTGDGNRSSTTSVCCTDAGVASHATPVQRVLFRVCRSVQACAYTQSLSQKETYTWSWRDRSTRSTCMCSESRSTSATRNTCGSNGMCASVVAIRRWNPYFETVPTNFLGIVCKNIV